MTKDNASDVLSDSFIDDALLLNAPAVPTRHDLKNGRWYESGGVWKPSVTTILSTLSKGIGYDKWLGNSASYEAAVEYRDKAADRGSRLHTLIAQLIMGGTIDISLLPENEIKVLLGFREFWVAFQPIPLAVECPLFHPDLPVAGTVDLICRIDDKNYIIDFKTGALWPSYQIQLSWYAHLTEAIFPVTIDAIAALRLYEYRGETPKYQFKKYSCLERPLLDSLYDWWAWGNTAQPRFDATYPETLSLEA